MIEFGNLVEGMKVWWGFIKFNDKLGSYRVVQKMEPAEYTVKIDTTGRAKLYDEWGRKCWISPDFSKSNYGQGIFHTLYDSKEELIDDWNSVVNQEFDKLEKYNELAKKYINKQFLE